MVDGGQHAPDGAQLSARDAAVGKGREGDDYDKENRAIYLSPRHRRRMEREAKAKVVASVWGAEFF